MSLDIISEVSSHLNEEVMQLWSSVSGVTCNVGEPDVAEHGDLSTNLAMVLAKHLSLSPREVARTFVSHIKSRKWFSDYFTTVAIAEPGFINFNFRVEPLFHKLGMFLSTLNDAELRTEKVVIEHTNVNPNKAMHIGHLRNSVLGDVMNRILKRVGSQTEVQYYVDDTGVQVADTYLGLQLFENGDLQKYTDKKLWDDIEQIHARYKGGAFKYDYFCWYLYTAISTAYEQHPHLLRERDQVLHEVERGGSETAQAVHELAQRILADHLDTMADFKIPYDLFVWESDILGSRFWDQAFTLLKRKGIAVKETIGKNKGCWVMKFDGDVYDEKHSLDKVLVKSDGSVTYTGKDIAYHLWKFNKLGKDFRYQKVTLPAPVIKKFASYDAWRTAIDGSASKRFGHADKVYNVIDVRQSYPQRVVKAALERLGFSKEAASCWHVGYGVVSLTSRTVKIFSQHLLDTEKKTVAMSGRQGIGVPVDRLLHIYQEEISRTHVKESSRQAQKIDPKAIAVAAMKYFLLRYNPKTDIVFDFDEALSLKGSTGIYIQYAHARAAGILENAKYKSLQPIRCRTIEAEEWRVLKKLYLLPHVLQQAAADLNVNNIALYAYQLAEAFNSFYEAYPVIKAPHATQKKRLAIVYGVKAVLADALAVLGIEAPDRM